MNRFEKNSCMMNYDGLRGCIFSDKFEDFNEFEEANTSRVIDIVEIKDTACDAIFPDESKLLDGVHNKNLSSFGKISHQSKIPRITKSSARKSHISLLPHQVSELKIKIPENGEERPMKRSKLPIRETHSYRVLKPTINSDVKIYKNKSLPDTPEFPIQTSPVVNLPLKILESKVSNDKSEESSSTESRKNYRKAQRIGAKIGQKISTLLEHIKKKQISSDSSSPSDDAILIMKKVLRRDITTKNVPQAKKNIFPQFYIGSTPSELKLFRLGDEWTDL